jgi:anaphase-promoting complex subunit 8
MDQNSVRAELRAAVMELSLRSLSHAAKWCAELLRQITDSDASNPAQTPSSSFRATSGGSFSIYADGSNASSTSFSGRQSPPLLMSASGARRSGTPTSAQVGPRGLRRTPRINAGSPGVSAASPLPQFYSNPFSDCDDSVLLAKTYMDLREYSRAAHCLEGNQSPLGLFVRLYATLLAGEKRKSEELAQKQNQKQEGGAASNMDLPMLKQELCELHQQRRLDAHGLYLYALVAKYVDDGDLCRSLVLESVHKFPYNFSCWELLKGCCENMASLKALQLPNHFMSEFFLSDALLEHQEQADVQIREVLTGMEAKFPQSTFVLAQQAMCHYNARQFDEAEELFEELREIDPYRLDHMDTYSNILYVKESKAALSFLAHSAFQIDKFNPKTCCIVGNYYSLKQQHEKAVSYFQRALRLDRGYLSAWTLMGHEFVEMRNTSAAIEAYRRAVDINPRDYRAWYGLGQTYELLQMHTYGLYYFGRAALLRPYDSRMWCAMADRYENLGRTMDAIKCYVRAESNSDGDDEGAALIKLAKLYERVGDMPLAATYYRKVLAKRDSDAKSGTGAEDGARLLDDSADVSMDTEEETHGQRQVPVDQNTIDSWWFLALHSRTNKDWAAAEHYCAELLDRGGSLLDSEGAIRDQVKALLVESRMQSQSAR